MKARNWLWASCLAGACVAFGCSDDAANGGGYGICGNGVIETGETCDDGNTVGGDGCSASCQQEDGWTCHEGKPCEPNGGGICGNGKVETNEVCDDGNTAGGDGCSADCKRVESGWTCPPNGGTCTEKDDVCGDGIVGGSELCDDGNTAGGDGCSADCSEIEKGWTCPPEGGKCSQTGARCGDGIVNRAEEACDDGGNSFGCTSDCKIADGYNCSVDADGMSHCWAMECGDGILDPKNGEECDDGANNAEDGYGLKDDGTPKCNTNCKLIPYCGDGTKNGDEECDRGTDGNNGTYGQKDACTPECKNAGWCGDGVYQAGYEKCDPKDKNSNGGCTDDCKAKDGYRCRPDTGACINYDELPEPGCGTVSDKTGKTYIDLELGEECDQAGNGCTDQCKTADGYKCVYSPKPCSTCSEEEGKQCEQLKCGDGLIDPDGYEECDMGSDNGKGLGCTASCTVEPGYVCKSVDKIADGAVVGKTSSCDTFCGDGVRTKDEECDAGQNNGAGKGCSGNCTIEEYAICTSNNIGATSKCSAGTCGDGKIGKGEMCDDGNAVGGDGCSADCKAVEAYYKCGNDGKGKGGACTLTKCGDGKLNDNVSGVVGEECDLGTGNGEGKGCTLFCRLEPGYECANSGCTSVRAKTECGDGVLGDNEECDDGNAMGGDGCSPECRRETGFECFNADKSTPSVCRPTCGDGIWNITSAKIPGATPSKVTDLLEECDLGAQNGKGLGCTADCKLQDGYYLDLPQVTYPDTIELPVTYRDFKGIDVTESTDKSTGSNKGLGRATDKWINAIKNKYKFDGSTNWGSDCDRTPDGGDASRPAVPKNKMTVGSGHPDFENMSGNLCTGVMGTVGVGILGSDGKPVLTQEAFKGACKTTHEGVVGSAYPNVRNHYFCQASFDTWYRDDAQMNKNISGKLLLAKVAGKQDMYEFDSANPPADAASVNGTKFSAINEKTNAELRKNGYFAPLYAAGFNEGIVTDQGTNGKYLKDWDANGSFTTEIYTTIQYRGEEATLYFSGDDDVWVYLNNRLFVDVGGMHSALPGSGTIKAEKCSNGQICDKTFGLYKGGIYDLRIFHAERARTASNFKLTLTGFVPTAKTVPADYKTICGDGIVAVGKEECDYGDKTKNANTYKLMACDPNTCMKIKNNAGKTCGNGIVEEGETCDTGYLCNQDAYKAVCKTLGLSYKPNANCDETSCKITGATCGNGIVETGEECDPNDPAAKADCTPMCTVSRCGDGYVDTKKGEQCDMGDIENAKGIVCTEKCEKPYCGDGIVSVYNGEVCDDGVNDGSYGHCGVGCSKWGPRCGDGIVQTVNGEKCDNGAANSDTAYGGCTTSCEWGPRCGDGIVQYENEECDDGPKNGTSESNCSQACRLVIN